MAAIEFFSFIFGFIFWSLFYGDQLLWVTISAALKVVAREKIDCINQQLEVSPYYKFTPDHLCELTPVLKKLSLPLSKSYNIHQHELLCDGATDKKFP